jgi:chromosome partitioning protein
MPVVVFASSKGGCGKTTCAVILGSELAQRGASVTIIDADPNRNVADWAKLPGVPAGLDVLGEVTEENIVEAIENASQRSAFVIADLEGSASLLVSYAVAMADFVLIPCQGSQMDARQAGRMVKLITTQSRIAGREIPFALVLTRTSPTIVGRTQRHIEGRFGEMALPVLVTRVHDREAFRSLFSYGGTLSGLSVKAVSNLPAAQENARQFVAEIVERLRGPKQEVA